jgi:hypothetical protein
MGRPRKWASDAERKAALRANPDPTEDPLDPGERELLAAITPGPPVVEDVLPGTNLPRFKRNRPAPPLEQYVAASVGDVKVLVATGKLTNPVYLGEDRLARAERYARWRWQAYRDGEIASL